MQPRHQPTYMYIHRIAIPVLEAKHLKLLSQKPQTKMTSQLGREEKQAADAEAL